MADNDIELFSPEGVFNFDLNNIEGVTPQEEFKPRDKKEAAAYADYIKSGSKLPFKYDPTPWPQSSAPTKNLIAQVTSPLMTVQGRTNALAEVVTRPGIEDEFNNIINQLKPQKESAIAQVRKVAQDEAEAEGKLIQLQLTKGELAAKRFKDQQIQDQRVAADREGFISLNGVNTEQADSVARQVGAANIALFKELNPLGQEIGRLQSASFLDDPATWLSAQFELPGLVGKYNAIAANINRGDQFIKSQNALVTSTNAANAGKLATKSAEEVETLANEALINANIEAQKAEINKAKLAGAGAKAEQEINDRYNNTILQLKQKKDLDQDRDDSRKLRERALLDSEDQAIQRNIDRKIAQKRQLDADEIKEEARIEQKIRDNRMAEAARAVGMPGVISIKDFDKEQDKNKKKILKIVYDSDRQQIATTPLELIESWKYIQNGLNNPDIQKELDLLYTKPQRQMVKVVADQINVIKAQANKPGGAGEKGEVLTEHINTGVTNYFKQMMSKPEEGKNNFYAPGSILEFANIPSMKGNLAAMATIETGTVAAKSGSEVNTAKMLTTLASQAASEKSLTKAAEDVVAMYSDIVANNNKTLRFNRMGLPEQDSFPVDIKGKKYDMLNPVDTHMALLELYKDSHEFMRKYFGTNPVWKPSVEAAHKELQPLRNILGGGAL